MMDTAYVRRMTRYNRWQNQNLYGVADQLSDEERRRERGAFFGSIHKTLSHILWADQMWMSRLAGMPQPQGGIPDSVSMFPDWAALKRERSAFDEAMIAWADTIDATALAGDLTWFSAAVDREITKPRWVLITQVFNHQTHHRGQVHCMLTQAGGRPHATDVQAMPE
jgi:uncharacterized damage-inducible protein DinB